MRVDYQQRLGRIVDWMRTVGDPWMRDDRNMCPQPGSDLAADDADKPATSPLAHYGIVMALAHLGAVVDVMVGESPRRRHWAHLTTPDGPASRR